MSANASQENLLSYPQGHHQSKQIPQRQVELANPPGASLDRNEMIIQYMTALEEIAALQEAVVIASLNYFSNLCRAT